MSSVACHLHSTNCGGISDHSPPPPSWLHLQDPTTTPVQSLCLCNNISLDSSVYTTVAVDLLIARLWRGEFCCWVELALSLPLSSYWCQHLHSNTTHHSRPTYSLTHVSPHLSPHTLLFSLLPSYCSVLLCSALLCSVLMSFVLLISLHLHASWGHQQIIFILIINQPFCPIPTILWLIFWFPCSTSMMLMLLLLNLHGSIGVITVLLLFSCQTMIF